MKISFLFPNKIINKRYFTLRLFSFYPYQDALYKPIQFFTFWGWGKVLVLWKYSSMEIPHIFCIHHGEIIKETNEKICKTLMTNIDE